MRHGLMTGLATGLMLMLLAVPSWAAGLNDVITALEAPFKGATPEGQRIDDYEADFLQESKIASLDRLQRARGRVSVRFDYPKRNERSKVYPVPLVMFDWQYDEPTTQEFVSNGKTLWVHLPENNQVIVSDIGMVSKAGKNDAMTGRNDPMTFLTGLGNLSRDFSIMFAEPARDMEGNYVLELRPLSTTALLNRMVIVVDRHAVEGADVVPGGKNDKDKEWESFTNLRKKHAGTPPLGPEPAGGLVFPILSTTVYDPTGNSTLIEFDDVRLNRGISPSQFNFILPGGVEVIRPTGKGMGF